MIRGNAKHNTYRQYKQLLLFLDARIHDKPRCLEPLDWTKPYYSTKGLWKYAFGMYRALRALGVKCEKPPGYISGFYTQDRCVKSRPSPQSESLNRVIGAVYSADKLKRMKLELRNRLVRRHW